MHDQHEPVSRPLRVLVVDDEFLIADHIAYTLECAGHFVVGTAPTGEQALQLLNASPVDLSVVDIKLMGPMDGIDLASKLKERGVPHVFISGSGDPATRARAEATNPRAFLQKPFNEQELLAVVESIGLNG